MKYTFFLSLLFCGTFSNFAQAQNIPDANFANAIRAQCPTCIDANNNLLAPATTLTTLTVGSSNISSYSGIGGFTNLIAFNCDTNQVTQMPTLPNTLQSLSCGENQLSTLPTLPPNLTGLYCGGNQISILPALPSTLQRLYCRSNRLTSLPVLPPNLRDLSAYNNQLTSLPALPSTLTSLEVFLNRLTSIPALPNGLTYLSVFGNNQLQCLPILPATLTQIQVFQTAITCLPNIPAGIAASNTLPICATNNPNFCEVFTQLQGRVFIDYDNNCVFNSGQDSLAVAGIGILAVDAQNNQFITYSNPMGEYALTLPAGQYTVQAYYNPSHYVSPCPSASVTIGAQGTLIQQDLGLRPAVNCPLLETEIDANLLRRCMTGLYTVNYRNKGTLAANNAYIDITFDNFLSYVSNTANISATNLGNNTYRFPVGNLGASQSGTFQATVSVSCDAVLGQVHCSEAHIYPDSVCGLAWNGAIINILDSCITDSVVFRLVNSGTNMLATQTYRIIEDNVMYLPPTPFQLSAGGVLNVTVPTRPNRTYRIEVQQAPNYPAMLGDSLAWSIIQNCNGISNVNPNFVNQFYTNNVAPAVSSDCTPNRGSYDPNQKTAQLVGYGAQHFIPKNTPLDYKIEFQNTGTDTAFRVVILDSLDLSVLDPNTIEIGTSSHNFTWELLQNRFLRFTFNNILLVDSFTNEPLSHGYVTFKIRQKNNLPLGTRIENRAAIYFDFNAPIITNTCFHTIGENFITLSVEKNIVPAAQVRVFPNPFQNEATLEVQGANYETLTLKITDVAGRQVQASSSTTQQIRISRENLPTGLYFYQLFGDGQLLNTGKLIAE
jgi:hypothetical protein